MPIGFSADPAWATYSSYYVEIDVEIEEVYGSATYVAQNINKRLYPDGSGNFFLSIKELLQGKFGDDMQAWGSTLVTECTGILRKYRYVLKDYGDGTLLATYTSTEKIVINAGLNHNEFQDLPIKIGQGKFLTHQPRVKLVRHWQPEFLFYPLRNSDTFRVSIDLIHEDSSITTWEPSGYSITGDYGQVAIFPVGYNQLNIEGQATDIIAWKVSVLNSSDQLYSEIMEYRIDPVMSELDRYYYFQNSFGAWDVLRTTGKVSKRQVQTSSVELVTSLTPTYDQRMGNYLREGFQDFQTFTQATGWGANKEYVEWYRDLFRSEKIFRISGHEPNLDGTQASAVDMYQIQLLGNSFSLPEDEEYSFATEFSYREAYINHGL